MRGRDQMTHPPFILAKVGHRYSRARFFAGFCVIHFPIVGVCMNL
jgi:hypothetical protein